MQRKMLHKSQAHAYTAPLGGRIGNAMCWSNRVLRRVALGCALVAYVGVYPLVAGAEGLHDPVAIQLKSQGDAAIETGRFVDALDAYSKALSIEPTAALHYNRGRALQGLGRNAEALDEFEIFTQTASDELRGAVSNLDEMVVEVRRRIAEVRVDCAIPGATLHVLDKVFDLPLRQPLRFDPASIDFEVVAPDHEAWRQRVTLSGGQERTIVPQLKRTDPRSLLHITANSPDARIELDGVAVGTAPLEVRVSEGEHRIRIAHPDYHPAERHIVLRPHERRSLSVTLEHQPRWYQRWWFWTGVGTVVATGVVVAVVASTERSPSKGDIPPGQLTAPLIAP